jgi:hypothetical protein
MNRLCDPLEQGNPVGVWAVWNAELGHLTNSFGYAAGDEMGNLAQCPAELDDGDVKTWNASAVKVGGACC